jgi:N6-adenosine-specific RNA methylase IME4
MYPGRSRIELFAKGEPREGWKTWGLEATAATAPQEAVVHSRGDTPLAVAMD